MKKIMLLSCLLVLGACAPQVSVDLVESSSETVSLITHEYYKVKTDEEASQDVLMDLTFDDGRLQHIAVEITALYSQIDSQFDTLDVQQKGLFAKAIGDELKNQYGNLDDSANLIPGVVVKVDQHIDRYTVYIGLDILKLDKVAYESMKNNLPDSIRSFIETGFALRGGRNHELANEASFTNNFERIDAFERVYQDNGVLRK